MKHRTRSRTREPASDRRLARGEDLIQQGRYKEAADLLAGAVADDGDLGADAFVPYLVAMTFTYVGGMTSQRGDPERVAELEEARVAADRDPTEDDVLALIRADALYPGAWVYGVGVWPGQPGATSALCAAYTEETDAGLWAHALCFLHGAGFNHHLLLGVCRHGWRRTGPAFQQEVQDLTKAKIGFGELSEEEAEQILAMVDAARAA